MKYQEFNLLLINVVKEQQTQFSQLQRQLSDHSNQLKQQQNQIEMMKKLLCLDHPQAAFCQ